jgi:hypothetical protein
VRVFTSIQQETWIKSLASGGRMRAIPALLQVEGDLDLPQFQAAVTATAAAHDSLRTGFRLDDPSSAWVAPAGADDDQAAVRFVDARGGTDIWPDLHRDITEPFALKGTSRIRPVIVQTGERTYLLGVAADHLAVDGRSVALLAREVLARYAGTAPAGARSASYADFARRQRELVAGAWGERRREYWFGYFDRWGPDHPACPLAVPGPPGQNMMLRANLGPRAAGMLDGTARQYASTRFGVLASVLSWAQIASSGAAVAGLVTDFHGRVLPSTWATIGLFSHGLRMFLDRSETRDLSVAVRTLSGRLDAARRLGFPLRPLADAWLAAADRKQGYADPHYVYLGARPRLSRNLGGVPGLRVTPVDAGRLVSKPLEYLWLNLEVSAGLPVLRGRFNDGLFPPAVVTDLVRTAVGFLGPAPDLEISYQPMADAALPAPAATAS